MTASVMEERVLGRTERPVSVVGLGTWQLGADWGEVTEAEARSVLTAAVESGVTFLDTADVYGDGRSEQLIGRFLADHPDLVLTVATKMGRRVEQRPENYTLDNFRTWLDRSRLQPRGRPDRPGATALSTDRCLLPRRDVRRVGHAGRRRGDRRVRGER